MTHYQYTQYGNALARVIINNRQNLLQSLKVQDISGGGWMHPDDFHHNFETGNHRYQFMTIIVHTELPMNEQRLISMYPVFDNICKQAKIPFRTKNPVLQDERVDELETHSIRSEEPEGDGLYAAYVYLYYTPFSDVDNKEVRDTIDRL